MGCLFFSSHDFFFETLQCLTQIVFIDRFHQIVESAMLYCLKHVGIMHAGNNNFKIYFIQFKALHFSQLPGGHVPAEFAQRLADFMQARSQ